jgi:hypothetical protein
LYQALGRRRRLKEHLAEEILGPPRVTDLRDLRLRGGLGGRRVAGAGAAAVYQDEARDALRRNPVRFEYDPASHAVADEDWIRQLEIVDERHHVAAVVLNRAILRAAGRLPVRP